MQRFIVNIRGTFALFVLVGGAFIFALTRVSNQGTGSSSAHWILMAIVLGLMVIFGFIIWIRSQGQYATEGDAETFYYLGFVYTLLTLVATFTPLLIEGSKPSTQQVLGFFGLGLITTFFGLTGRIFFLQPQSSVSPEISADRLSRAYEEAARRLESSALLINKVSLELEKNTRQSQEALATSLERATQKIADDSQSLFEDANRHVVTLTVNTAEHISHTLSTTTEGVSAALEGFKKRVAALKLPPSEFGERLSKNIESLINATTAATDSASQFETNISAATNELTKMASGASLVADGLNLFSNATQNVSKEVKQSEDALSNLSAQVGSLKKSLSTITPTLENISTVAQKAVNDFVSVQKGAHAFYSAFDDLANVAVKATPALDQLGSQVSDVGARLAQLVTAISSTEELARKVTGTQLTVSAELMRGVELLRAHQKVVEDLSRNLEQDLQISENALRKVHSNLITATDFITTKVQLK